MCAKNSSEVEYAPHCKLSTQVGNCQLPHACKFKALLMN